MSLQITSDCARRNRGDKTLLLAVAEETPWRPHVPFDANFFGRHLFRIRRDDTPVCHHCVTRWMYLAGCAERRSDKVHIALTLTCLVWVCCATLWCGVLMLLPVYATHFTCHSPSCSFQCTYCSMSACGKKKTFF